MGEIRIFGPGKTRGYPYPVCKKFLLYFSMNYRDLSVKIETDNLTVSNSEIITFDFTVSKKRIFVK